MSIIGPQKTYYKDGIKVEEFYNEDELWMYTTTEVTKTYKFVKHFFSDNICEAKEKIHYNENGVPCRQENWVRLKGDQYNYFDEIIPVFKGYEDAGTMTELDKKELSKLINRYFFNKDIPKNEIPW